MFKGFGIQEVGCSRVRVLQGPGILGFRFLRCFRVMVFEDYGVSGCGCLKVKIFKAWGHLQ